MIGLIRGPGRPPFDRAVEECRRWGIEVRFDNTEKHNGWGGPVFDCVITDAKFIVWGDQDRGPHAASALLHEMAHVIAFREVGDSPPRVRELAYMLAIEHEANRRIKAGWSEWMEDFGTYHGDWSRISPTRRHEYLEAALLKAEQLELMKNKKPTYKGGPGA